MECRHEYPKQTQDCADCMAPVCTDQEGALHGRAGDWHVERWSALERSKPLAAEAHRRAANAHYRAVGKPDSLGGFCAWQLSQVAIEAEHGRSAMATESLSLLMDQMTPLPATP